MVNKKHGKIVSWEVLYKLSTSVGNGAQIERATHVDSSISINIVAYLNEKAKEKGVTVIPLDYPGILVLLKEIISLYTPEEIERELGIKI